MIYKSVVDFMLHLLFTYIQGKDLAARDANGLSDPYVRENIQIC